jgi:steroid 5-alpha reductase family enzyme
VTERLAPHPTAPGRAESFVRVGATYVVALGVGGLWLLAGPDSGRLWLDALVADVLATLVVFASSRLHRNSSLYDAYWSVVPPLLMLWWWTEREPGTGAGRFALLAVVMVLWAVRLTANWAWSWPGLVHEDWRYPLLRERAGRFGVLADLFGIHLVPTVQVFLALLPVYVVCTRPGRDLGWLDVVALVVGLGSVTLETVADLQMRRFAATAVRGQVMDRGVWSWSRHPNYLGELGFWVAMALFGLAASPGDWWVVVGAVGIGAMLQLASIPMMEERSLQRRPEYQQVVDRVSRFLPRPPRGARA